MSHLDIYIRKGQHSNRIGVSRVITFSIGKPSQKPFLACVCGSAAFVSYFRQNVLLWGYSHPQGAKSGKGWASRGAVSHHLRQGQGWRDLKQTSCKSLTNTLFWLILSSDLSYRPLNRLNILPWGVDTFYTTEPNITIMIFVDTFRS